MATIKAKFLYVFIALLFLCVLLLIGWLANMLFAMRILPDESEPEPIVTVKHAVSGRGPVSETLIEAGADVSLAPEDEPVEGDLDESAGATNQVGHIPCLCEAYGPAITQREAHPNPLTFRSELTANRALITVNLKPDGAGGVE